MQATRTILAAAISVPLINHAYAVNESTQDQTGSDNYADVFQRAKTAVFPSARAVQATSPMLWSPVASLHSLSRRIAPATC